jgi:hypothetical protein
MRFSELLTASGLNYDHDAGQFCYHLSELIARHIVEKIQDEYGLTAFGIKIAEMLDFLESESGYLFDEEDPKEMVDLDENDLEIEWIGSNEEYHVERKSGEGNMRLGFNTKPSYHDLYVKKLPEGPEKERLRKFINETEKWDGLKRVLTKDEDQPLGWAIVGTGISSRDKPIKGSDKPKVEVTTSMTIETIAAWSINPYTEAQRRKVILGLTKNILKKAEEIGAIEVNIRSAHADDNTLIEVLKSLGFRRTTTYYEMKKSLPTVEKLVSNS